MCLVVGRKDSEEGDLLMLLDLNTNRDDFLVSTVLPEMQKNSLLSIPEVHPNDPWKGAWRRGWPPEKGRDVPVRGVEINCPGGLSRFSKAG